MSKKDVLRVEDMLRDMEDDCVTACGRYLAREPSTDNVWMLCGEKNEFLAVMVNSRSTLIPVLCGMNEIPSPLFLKRFFRLKKIYSVQGLKNEVLVLEKDMERFGKKVSEIIDYDLMCIDRPPVNKGNLQAVNIVLRVPKLTDLNALAPLQAAYEQEEVLHKGSVFSPAASRINLANIIASGRILAAELNGRLVGKINVSAVSFTRYQVGGVYVHPDFRGLGIARRMASEFITSLVSEGRGVTLFVKKTNLPARRLYAGLGFTVRGDYRITYY
jgi:ribosomal protein S18 acetylase RimI-like enzyme